MMNISSLLLHQLLGMMLMSKMTRPETLIAEQEGKIWNDTDAVVDYFWDEDQPGLGQFY